MKLLLDSDIYIRLALAFFLVFILSKPLGILFQELFKKLTGAKKNKTPSIDELIRAKSTLLRTSMPIKDSQSSKSSEKKFKTKTHKEYHDLLKSSSNSKFQLPKIFKLLDCIEWGHGQPIKDIYENLKSVTEIQYGLEEFSTLVIKSIRSDYFIRLNVKRALTYDEINEFFILYVIVDYYKKTNSKKYFSHILRAKDPSRASIDITLNQLLKSGSIAETFDIIKKYALKYGSLNHSLFVENFKTKFELAQMITPLKEATNIESAKKLLGIDSDFDKEIVSRSYKKKAMSLHPDSLTKNGLEDYIEIANKNFVIIGKAKELLLNNC